MDCKIRWISYFEQLILGKENRYIAVLFLLYLLFERGMEYEKSGITIFDECEIAAFA